MSTKTHRLASARRRIRSFIDQICELETADFAHLDGRHALSVIKDYAVEASDQLERIPESADDASIDRLCEGSSLMVSRFTSILGFILRSTNVRNAFEVHFPLKRLIQQAVDADANLIMSSEWEFVPFTYPMNVHLLPTFVLVGSPVSESENVLIVPLAGHEIGHSAWRSHQIAQKINENLAAAIVAAIENFPDERDFLLNQADKASTSLSWLQNAVLQSSIKQLEEIFCDLFGLFVFGESYLFAYHYFLVPGGDVRDAYYPSSGARVNFLVDAANILGVNVPDDLFGTWRDSPVPRFLADQSILQIADNAVASTYPTLRDITFGLLAELGVARPASTNVDRIRRSLHHHVPDGQGGTLAEIISAGWLHLRDRGGLSLESEAAEYRMLNELMLKSIETSEFKLRVDGNA